MKRTCATCGKEKHVMHFYRTNYRRCKECMRKHQAAIKGKLVRL